MLRSHPSISRAHTFAINWPSPMPLSRPLDSFELSNEVQLQLGCSIILKLLAPGLRFRTLLRSSVLSCIGGKNYILPPGRPMRRIRDIARAQGSSV